MMLVKSEHYSDYIIRTFNVKRVSFVKLLPNVELYQKGVTNYSMKYVQVSTILAIILDAKIALAVYVCVLYN